MTIIARAEDYAFGSSSLEDICIPLGYLISFCAQHHLFAAHIEEAFSETISKARLQDGQVSELFVSLGAVVDDSWFSPTGQTFLAKVLDSYPAILEQLFGIELMRDDWGHYYKVAKKLGPILYGRPSSDRSRVLSGIRKILGKFWK